MSKSYEELIKEQISEHQRLDPVKPGYTRIYGDHTYRWYEDLSPEEMEANRNDPLMKILNEEITKVINAEIIAKNF